MQTESMILPASSISRPGRSHLFHTLVPARDVQGTLSPATQLQPKKIYTDKKFAYTKARVDVLLFREKNRDFDGGDVDWLWHPLPDKSWVQGMDTREHYVLRAGNAEQTDNLEFLHRFENVPLDVRYTMHERRDWGIRKTLLRLRAHDLKRMPKTAVIDSVKAKIVRRTIVSHVILDADGYQGVWYQLV